MDLQERLDQTEHQSDTNENTEVVRYELTPEEEMIFCSVYVDEDRIINGRLFQYQVKELERLRFGRTYLEEKYPGKKFVFRSFAPATKVDLTGKVLFSLSEDEENLYRLRVKETDSGFEAADDYYKDCVREAYDRMLQGLIRDSLGINSLTYTEFLSLKGPEINGNTPVDSLIAEKDRLSRDTVVFLDGRDVENNTASELKKLFKDNILYGSYGVYYANNLLMDQQDGKKLLEEVNGVDRSVVERFYFNCFDIEE